MEQDIRNDTVNTEINEELPEETSSAFEEAPQEEKPVSGPEKNEEENPEPEKDKEEKPESEEKGKEKPEEKSEKKPAENPKEAFSQNESFHKKKEKSGKFFGKKDAKEEKIEELEDRLKRNMAEFENFRKRTEKEKASMYDVGARDIIEKVLPVLDNFERGINTMPEEEKGTPFAEGMVMIYKQLAKTLEDAGVEVIEAEGKPFDPQLHNAVMHIEDDSYGENVVSQELQKGYKYHGTVIRHSLVQVAN